MPPTRQDPVTSAVGEAASAAGYRRRRNTWYRDGEETIIVVNVQKSQYGEQFYVNLGVFVQALDDARFPPVHSCHLCCRLETLVPESEQSMLKAMLDLERTIDDSERRKMLTGCLQAHGLPFLEGASTVAGLRRVLKENSLVRAHALLKLKELTGVS